MAFPSIPSSSVSSFAGMVRSPIRVCAPRSEAMSPAGSIASSFSPASVRRRGRDMIWFQPFVGRPGSC